MSNYHTQTSNQSNTSSTVVGINSQPYRTYLTDRNHFYQQQQQQQLQQQPLTTSSTNHTSSTDSAAAVSSNLLPKTTTITPSQALTNSRISLNSTSSNNRAMATVKSNNSNKHRSSTGSSSLPVATEYKAAHDTDDYDDDLYQPSACSRCLFGLLWCLAQIGLWGSVIMFGYWIFKFDKGFAWQNDKRKMFNLHAFLMLTGFIFVNGQSMLIYKSYVCCKRIYNKITHAIFFVLSISLVSFGMLIAIQAQHISSPDQSPVHFYSLHSWIGLVTCGLFGLQFFFGFVTFLVLLCCDRVTSGYRARFLPTHVTFGLAIFMLAVAGCLSGLLQTARSRLSGPSTTEPTKADYKDMQITDNNPLLNAGLVINAVGGCLIALAIIIPYLVRNFNHRYDSSASFRINH